MRRRCPDAQLASLRGQSVGEHDGALLGQPQRRLIAATPGVKGDEATRKLAAGLDELQGGLGGVVAEGETRAGRGGRIAPREQIEVANVIGLENEDGGWR